MKYGDLIQFEPITTVVHPLNAGQTARELVSSYVVSDEMAEKITGFLIPRLWFKAPADSKGVLVVGKYGTGKSHLLSVIAAIAENAEIVSEVKNADVASAARTIAGKFKVIRSEIGGSVWSLRDIVVCDLEENLEKMGVKYSFPPADQVAGNKRAFSEMMDAFQQKHPGKGLLLVVDELWDHLHGRLRRQLALDLAFLKEMGEVFKETRFRFIAGARRTIVDNPRFSFSTDSTQRLKDHFEQIQVTQKDVKYVVAERMLKKTADQRDRIRERLAPYLGFYNLMNERLDEFVRLFPVHPAYIDSFKRFTVVEKREVFKDLSFAVKNFLNHEIPEDHPGLITSDYYWKSIVENPVYRMTPDIKAVVESGRKIESNVRRAFTRADYTSMAMRIIAALSIHRLNHGDIYAGVGLTAEELRDSLCLYQAGIEDQPGDPAQNLLELVETVLGEIRKADNGRVVSFNRTNKQYYLDLEKKPDLEHVASSQIGAIPLNNQVKVKHTRRAWKS